MTINKEVKERKVTHMRNKYTSIRGKDGEYRMKHTPGCDWWAGECHCGANILNAQTDTLTAALVEARKKPEPGEFNTTNEYSRLAGKKRSELTGAEARLLGACDEIDRLTAELAVLKDELTCEECEKSLEYPETGVTAFCMACWNAMITKLRAEIEAKDEEIGRLAETILRFDNYCRVNDIDLEQALKGE